MGKRNINTEAIVIKRINYKDADKILTLYTKDLGKISARAIGIRKLTSKKKSHLELLNIANLSLVEGNHWFIVTQAQIINPISGLKKDLKSASKGYYVAEVFNSAIPDGEENKTLYKFLKKTLLTLDQNLSLKVVNAFNIKLLNILGFYSQNSLNIQNLQIKSHMHKLLNLTYEQINDYEMDEKDNQTTHQILKTLTEEVIEREIKTNLS